MCVCMEIAYEIWHVVHVWHEATTQPHTAHTNTHAYARTHTHTHTEIHAQSYAYKQNNT